MALRRFDEVCGCLPVGRHYPGIADRIARAVSHVEGLVEEFEPSSPWQRLPIVAIDMETTGREPAEDRVIEVGVVRFEGGQVVARSGWLVDPGRPIPERVREITGIGDEDVRGQPSFAERLPDLLAVLQGAIPLAYNASFDRGFLHAEVGRLPEPPSRDAALPPALRPQVAWLDPLVWVRELLARDIPRKRLGDACTFLGIPLEQAHRAADDAEAAGRVLFALAERGGMPASYAELVRLQEQYAARQEAEFAVRSGRRRS